MSAVSSEAKRIFLEAVENHPLKEWPEFLEKAIGDDVLLRSSVERLLNAHCQPNPLLDEPGLVASVACAAFPETQGTEIGPYRLLHQLGRGGMGVVYEAEQLSVGRRVALKILPFAALLNETQLERFNTEATAAARLQHSGIVQVYSVGCERGIHFLAMQLIDGPSLADVFTEMRNERHLGDKEEVADTVVANQADVLTRDEDGGHYRAVARIGREAAEALQYAHDNGVLHRDIKPSNLLLDKSGHVWIADFGLARVEDESQLTRTGDILGTLHYMSPEQATGERVDARSDVYSLGATLYEQATLQPVYESEDKRDTIKKVIAGNPIAPHQVDRCIPQPLSYVIAKSMARRLDERYQSAQELADDLQRFLDGEPVQAVSGGRSSRVRIRLHRRHVAATVTVALLLITCLALSLSESKRSIYTDVDSPSVYLGVFVDPGPGALKSPRGMTVKVGEFFVASAGDDRIVRYGASGTYLGDFIASGDGGVDYPVDIEFGSDGHAYVSSANNDAILRYNGTTGAYIDAFIPTGYGGLNRPGSVQFAQNDTLLYVASSHSDQILKYHGPASATPGVFIEAFVSDDEATPDIDESGGLDFPAIFRFHSDGYLYVGSFLGHEVLRYDADGSFVDKFISAGDPGDLEYPTDFAFRDEAFFIANRGSHSIQKYDLNGEYVGEYVQPHSGDLYSPRDFIFHTDGMLYVVSTATQQVLRYGADGTFSDAFVESRVGGLSTARGLASGPNGDFYVVSGGNNSVLHYDGITGEYMGAFVRDDPDTSRDETGGLSDPADLEFQGDYLYVTSSGNDSVLRYHVHTGVFDSTFVTAGDGGLSRPSEILFHGSHLYVSSSNTNSVLRYDAATGNFDCIFIGSDQGLNFPIGLVFDHADNLYGGNFKGHDILQFDAEGSFVRQFAPAVENGLYNPIDLAISDGFLFVTAERSDSVLRFDLATRSFVDQYVATGAQGLDAPRDLVVGTDNKLYVVSRYTCEVLRCKLPPQRQANE